MVQMAGEQPRRRTSLVGIAENDVVMVPNMTRRMSRSMLSDTGSSINSFKRSIAVKPRFEMVGATFSIGDQHCYLLYQFSIPLKVVQKITCHLSINYEQKQVNFSCHCNFNRKL